ncbi:peptidoglycan DD-metalloendopeptidase family protein [Pseudoalteromonas tunicata]|jgi:murein DD-endopeptidase MepM/ murein hydrolase activator NlpD|uniref:Putative peptidase, M23/M37 family protein n=1 Tax=Pseudoalteromonas tunicata D2 TaxID=87626 RepID=A4C6P3_9GAMM|nr:peptidoglycan DD-metalloendopeptidase family protein [Pseudoalteromonas tunicata]ATC95621.1 putative zinc metalloprotease [Pseudoalteromonas tunicata]AXT31190.1 peptidase M23 [Pseudoalteromonas tunicata]EAR29647.1 putative peptidase, M23/M37 family protein [Pseudoalteromonas tunicata D2]MDP4984983.1 peptidoglycan DD-metalloendopeptidase family protein [Pseudoalteromonas tunicata]MDP5212544.1 peptidoglycan DD-metalloendopeptidase family protein [Pseudoalteromonas tunicata]
MVTMVQKIPQQHKILIVVFFSVILTLILTTSEKAKASKDNNQTELEVGKRYELTLQHLSQTAEQSTQSSEVETATVEPVALAPEITYKAFTVKTGDNLAIIFKRAGFSAQTLYKLINLNDDTHSLTKIHPGEVLYLASNQQKELSHLKYQINQTDTLLVSLDENNQLISHIDSKQIETRNQITAGQIKTNFWNAGIEAGLTEKQIMNFADIFGWDIDFANDIRTNDQFVLIYETKYIEGEYIGTGEVIAAEFINQGEHFAAVRHDDGNYYTPEGRSMRKAFLRAPVNFKYISSSFNPKRKHPVTGQVKAHRGIDYAAKTGTPVMASGNGKVIESGYSKYNGNYVFIQHGSQYVTKYLHLHKRNVKSGTKVKQGQIIGTVGATGRVTGAHLHYEFLVNGVHRNPKTVALPKSESLAKNELATFKPYADTLIAQLSSKRDLYLAMQN